MRIIGILISGLLIGFLALGLLAYNEYSKLPVLTVTNKSAVEIDTVIFRGLKPDRIEKLEPGKTKSVKIQQVTVEDFIVRFVIGDETYNSSKGGYIDRRGGYNYHFIIGEDYNVTIKDKGYFGIF